MNVAVNIANDRRSTFIGIIMNLEVCERCYARCKCQIANVHRLSRCGTMPRERCARYARCWGWSPVNKGV